jgi:glycosyltransferase involved in cell wall biosynthesis
MSAAPRTVLWWGRFDPDYSRNRILRQCYEKLGWQVADFHPLISPVGDLEAVLRRAPRADLVHVPCFRQRDVLAAARFARRRGLPLVFDPLISAYDKQVYERGKVAPCSRAARELQATEQRQFAVADVVLADTGEHARFFAEQLLMAPEKIRVVAVGAEEALFHPENTPHTPNDPLEILFYGSFIPLQGPEVIIEAARVYRGPAVRWVLLGDGPLKAECTRRSADLPNVGFENWLPYTQLPDRIRRADILLGVFGVTPKTQRVIPNKVFQALACGKPLVTGTAPSYPPALMKDPASGVCWVTAGDPAALAKTVADLARQPVRLAALGARSRASYEMYFSGDVVTGQLRTALAALTPARG